MFDKVRSFLIGERNLLPGLDIGTSGLKLCKLRSRGSKYGLVVSSYVRYEEPVIAGTEIIDFFSLASLIEATLKAHVPGAKEVAIHIPLTLCFYTVISVPPEEDIEQSVINHVRGIITEKDIQNVNIKYRVLPVSIDEKFRDVAVVAVKKDVLEDRLNLLGRAGYKVSVIDVEPAALSNQFYLNYPDRTAEAACLVDMGASFTKIVISYGGFPYVTRNVEIGSETITEQLQKEYLLSYEDAERLKLGEDLKEVSYDDAFKNVISKTIKKLATEVVWAMDNFKDRFDRKVDAVFLYGGGSKQKGLVDLFKSVFKAEIKLGAPFGFSGLPNKQEFAVAAGLGLRYKGDENAEV